MSFGRLLNERSCRLTYPELANKRVWLLLPRASACVQWQSKMESDTKQGRLPAPLSTHRLFHLRQIRKINTQTRNMSLSLLSFPFSLSPSLTHSSPYRLLSLLPKYPLSSYGSDQVRCRNLFILKPPPQTIKDHHGTTWERIFRNPQRDHGDQAP